MNQLHSPNNTTTKESAHNRRLSRRDIALVTSLAMIGAGASWAGETMVGQARTSQAQEQTIKGLEQSNADYANQIATENAQTITEELGNNPNEPVAATILYGKVKLNGKNDQTILASGVNDPFVLATTDGKHATSFADVAYIGVQVQDGYMNGGIGIVAVKTTPDMSFAPSDTKEALKTVNVFESRGDDGSYLFGYDPSGQITFTSPEGSPLSPGTPGNVDIKNVKP